MSTRMDTAARSVLMRFRRENCNMLQKSLVKRDKSTRNTNEKRDKGGNSLEKVVDRDKNSLEKV